MIRSILKTLIPFGLGVFLTMFVLLGGEQGVLSKAKYITSQPNVDVAPATEQTTLQDEVTFSRQNAITRSIEKVSPAVVGINVTALQRYVRRNPFADDPFFRHFFQDIPIEQKVQGLGSGFLFSKDGYILTNEHVVRGATEILVTQAGGQQYQAKQIAADEVSDLAVLKIEGSDFPFIPFGDSDDVIIGEWTIALGNPFGLFDVGSKPTVTVGVISATKQNFGKQFQERIYEDMLQTDAAINSGNSGGPLVNCNGEVIGINTWIISGAAGSGTNIGLGFAIPINRVKRILDDLMNYGRVDRSYWTGIQYDELDPYLARYWGLQSTDGVIIADIQRGSPAARSGLEVGDVILAINSTNIRGMQDVRKIIENLDLKVGDSLKLKIYRNKKTFETNLKLEPLPEELKRRYR